jgi:hypothetical protein
MLNLKRRAESGERRAERIKTGKMNQKKSKLENIKSIIITGTAKNNIILNINIYFPALYSLSSTLLALRS